MTKPTKSAHTPGPWLAAWTPSGLAVSANGKRIAVIDGTNPHVNSHLIASAPELLEAAKNTLALIREQAGAPVPWTRMLAQLAVLDACIAKAEGKTNE